MKTYDRNRNAIATGSMVMIAGNGTTGVIKAIHGEGKPPSSCVGRTAWKSTAARTLLPVRSDPSRFPLIPAVRAP